MSIIEIFWVKKYNNYSKLQAVDTIKMNNYSIDFKIY